MVHSVVVVNAKMGVVVGDVKILTIKITLQLTNI